MSLLHRQALSVLETLHQQIQTVLTDLANECPQSTVWVATNDTNWISEIRMHYTETEVKLDVWLSDIPFQALELHISPETAVIRAKSLLDMVEGFFSAEHLEGIIPFPVAVHPETVSASLQHNLLSLTLPKSGQIERQRLLVRFNQVLDPSQSSSGMRRSLTFKGAKS